MQFPQGPFCHPKMHLFRKKGVHETRMNRMRAKHTRNDKMFKYLRIHTYVIGICICFAILSAYSSTIMGVASGHLHKGGRRPPPLWLMSRQKITSFYVILRRDTFLLRHFTSNYVILRRLHRDHASEMDIK